MSVRGISWPTRCLAPPCLCSGIVCGVTPRFSLGPVFACVCVHVRCACVHVCMCVHVRCACVHVCTRAVCMCACVRMCACVYVSACMCVFVLMLPLEWLPFALSDVTMLLACLSALLHSRSTFQYCFPPAAISIWRWTVNAIAVFAAAPDCTCARVHSKCEAKRLMPWEFDSGPK
jgi:hypothetical protein